MSKELSPGVESGLLRKESEHSRSMMLESIGACMGKLADVEYAMEEILAQLQQDSSENFQEMI